MLLIGLTGTKSSGKGEVAKYLQARDFQYYSLSDIVREEAGNRGIKDYTIKQLQDIGNELREKYGRGVLAKRIADKILIEKKDKYVIDGIRNLGEIEELRKMSNFYLISVDANEKRRFEFMLSRNRPSDPKTWPEFLVTDTRDKGSKELDIGQQVSLCMQQADFSIFNDSTLKSLHEKIEQTIKKIKN